MNVDVVQVWHKVQRWLVALLVAVGGAGAGGAMAAPPAAWTSTTWGTRCSTCHSSVRMQSWQTTAGEHRLKGLTAGNFISRLTARGGTMQTLAEDTSAAADTARAEILQYLIDARDGKVQAERNGVSSTTALDFGAVLVGQSATGTVSIVNERSLPITFTTSALSNGFSIDSPLPTTCAGNSVAAGQTCAMTVRFTPLARSPGLSATLTISPSPSTGDPALVARPIDLKGAALAPSISVATTPIPFSARTNFDSDTECVKVSNSGTATLSLTDISFTQPSPAPTPASNEYGLGTSNVCPTDSTLPVCATGTELAPSPGADSCQLVLRFTPKAEGSREGAVTISHNDPARDPLPIDLEGVALPTPIPSIELPDKTKLEFGERALNGASTSLNLKIKNGNADAAVLTWADPRFEIINVDPASASKEFSVAVGTCNTATLGSLADCSMSVGFAPTGSVEGERSATLRIRSTNASNSPVSVTITGTAKAVPDPKLTEPASFADTVAGIESPDTRTLVVENPRAHRLDYSVTRIDADADDFVVKSDACAGRINPLATCSITLAFKPRTTAALGPRNARLQLSFTGTQDDPPPATNPRRVALSGRATAPLGLSATRLSPTAPLTTSSTATAVLSNRGATRITLGTLTIVGTDAADYAFASSNGCKDGTGLEPASSCDLVMRFTPRPGATGTRSAEVQISHDTVGSPQPLKLEGNATPEPQGMVGLDAQALAYPPTELGSPAVRTLTLENIGNAPLTFSAFTIDAAAAADYSRSGSCSTAAPLAVDAECTLILTFRPTALGPRKAVLTIQSDASNGKATVTLTGTGVPVPVPVVTLSRATLDFGAQTIGGLYPKRSITVTNTGSAELRSITIATQGVAFVHADTEPCPATLAAGASCIVDIGFAPTAAGTDYRGTLHIGSNAAGSPHRVALRGSGTAALMPALVWSPGLATLDFGKMKVGEVSSALSAILLNQGPGGVKMTVLNAIGVDGAAFSVTSSGCASGMTLYEGQTCNVDVRFAPASAGLKRAIVQVASTGSFPPELNLVGTGSGGPSPELTLSATTLAFPATRVGTQSLPAEITLSASGAGAVRVTGMSVSGAYTVQTKSCQAVPFTLLAGSDCTLTLSFVPGAEGPAEGQLTVSSDATPAQREMALSGQGEKPADVVTGGGGGCSIGRGDSTTDPTLWALMLLAAVLLLRRHRTGGRGPR